MKKVIYTKQHYPHLDIGEYTYGKPRILGSGQLKIGKFCSIADGVTILLGVEHRTDWITTYPFSDLYHSARHIGGHPFGKGPVVIGNDVWIGQNATLLSGITIGDGAVIGACSVVARDVEPYAIVSGNPARRTRYRFDHETVKHLLKVAWWNWPLQLILDHIHILLSPNPYKLPELLNGME